MRAAGTITNLCPVLTLSIYTAIALHTGRRPLTASETFTTLSIVSLLSSPLSNLIYSGPKVTGALECFQRIQEYLLSESNFDDRVTRYLRHSMEASQAEEVEHGTTLELEASNFVIPCVEAAHLVHTNQADFGWKRQSAAILSDVNLTISPCSLTILVGQVGSGKSTLLKAILGEVPCLKGFIHVEVSEISFCDTKTWIRNRSIRDNICHPLPYDEEWYRTVISSTALDYDIDSLPQKDHTIIGSNGLSMSGGQRQRIAIARAAYARTKLAIFDDSLSALDTSTSALVFTRVFGSQGILRQHGTAVILATHNWNYLADADNVIFLGDGMIREQGPPPKLKILKSHKLEAAKANFVSSHEQTDGIQATAPSRNITRLDRESAKNQGDFRDYVYYFRASGGWSMILYAGALTVGVFCAQFTSKCKENFLLCFIITSSFRFVGPMVGGAKCTGAIWPFGTVYQCLCYIGHSWGWDLGFLHVASLLPHRPNIVM
jgi:ABC-type bacteriocin/lantibiotic exporter with double-glycine peptidase domain